MIDAAYRACARLAREHDENFPVASWLLPKASRPHIAAVYAFARLADDIADEGDRPAAERLARLEEWQWRLHEAAAGRAHDDPTADAFVFVALMETMRRCDLEVSLFEDLLSAFAQDVMVTRYETWTDLLEYCRRSANPIGRLVLRICGYRGAELDGRSDAICTALQLTNFWQDLAIDWAKGRLYVPRDLQTAAGAAELTFGDGTWPASWRTALGEAGRRTRGLFMEGRPLCDRVNGRLRYELRATWLGGVRILDDLERRSYDAFARRPRLRWTDAAAIGRDVWRWRGAGR